MLCFFVCIFALFYVDLKIVKACLYASHVILNAYFVHGVQLFVFNIFMFVCIICVTYFPDTGYWITLVFNSSQIALGTKEAYSVLLA